MKDWPYERSHYDATTKASPKAKEKKREEKGLAATMETARERGALTG